MKKIIKTKTGFTLVEMVLVIAIIVVLATVLIIGVTKYLQAANKARASIDQHNSAIGEVNQEIDHAIPALNMGNTI